MKTTFHSFKTAAFALLALVMPCALLRAQGEAWHDKTIGNALVSGHYDFRHDTLQITGAGDGYNQQKGDNLYFASLALPGGDVEVVARLVSLQGTPRANAGVMLRSGTLPASPTVLMAYTLKDRDGRDSIAWRSRDPLAPEHAVSTGGQGGMLLNVPCPIWMRLDRVGKYFAAYKSYDGRLWTPLGNGSGGSFAVKGPIEAGFFAASSPGGQTATANFDHIRIGKPHMEWRTSWVGNSFSDHQAGGQVDIHVANSIQALWTASDGTCYTNAYWDEGGSPIQAYRDGQVLKSFRDGNEAFGSAACGEGSITGDGTHVFLAVRHSLYMTDRLGTESATKDLTLDSDPYDAKKKINVISGLATVGTEVFIADSRDNCIRVVNPDQSFYYRTGNSRVATTMHQIDTNGVANAAPASIYQSQRLNDQTTYDIPGLTPGATYTVRSHLAAYEDNNNHAKPMRIGGSGVQEVSGIDVIASAGGKFKAYVLDIPGFKADASGKLSIVFTYGAVCAFEVLASNGSRAAAVNCGGPTIAGFQGESYEVSSRRFPFERPGPMVADKRGNLWIIQRGNDFPDINTVKYPTAIKCYKTDGTFTGQQIADVVNPTAIAYDPVKDRLLVADNGPNQNIRIYANLGENPVLATTFGVKGGLYAGAHPGLLDDPDAGGNARFYSLNGVGVDTQGAIYVSCGGQGTDLRKFTPDGKMAWMLNSLFFCNTPDVDPASGGSEIYSTYAHMHLDLTKKRPGKEWSYVGYNWDPFRFGDPPRIGGSQAVVRRIGPNRKLILFTSAQGGIGSIKLFRYDGEIAIPCGEISDKEIWIDADGDGKISDAEKMPMPPGSGIGDFCVDQRGDLWLDLVSAGAPGCRLRHMHLLGMNTHGVPLYGVAKGDYEDIPYPKEDGKPAGGWGNGGKVHYDADTDVMILTGPAKTRHGDKESPVQYMARYDKWSTGNRTARWLVTLPNPDNANEPDFMYSDRPYGLAFQRMGMDVAGDKIFMASLWGEVWIFDALTGVREAILSPGPELWGSGAWEDAAKGLTAFKTKSGEYLIFTENSGYNGKANFYRWKP